MTFRQVWASNGYQRVKLRREYPRQNGTRALESAIDQSRRTLVDYRLTFLQLFLDLDWALSQ